MGHPERILLTGGLGFQGAHLTYALLGQGRAVTVLNTPSQRAVTTAERMRRSVGKGLRIVYGSVNDPEIVEKVLPGHDGVIHMAAWASVDVSLDRPRPPLMINTLGTATLLDALRQGTLRPRILIGSSCEVYGPAPPNPHAAEPGEAPFLPQDESSPLLPHSPYAASKLGGDRLAYAYALCYDLHLTILRPSNIYGPGQRPGAAGAVIPTLTKAALAGGPLSLTGTGEQMREFLHVDDIVTAYTLLLDRDGDEPGEVYNFGSYEIRSIREIALALCHLTQSTGARLQSVLGRKADIPGFFLNSSKARSVLKWAPTVPFELGLTRYIDWARAQGLEAWR